MNPSTITRRTALAVTAAASTVLMTKRVSAEAKSDVIIIGAGLSSLNAALILEELGAKVTVLEGTNRIGGRLYTASDKDIPGSQEMGGSSIGAGYARLVDAANKFGVKLVPQRLRTEPRAGELMFHLYGQNIKTEE